VRDERLEGLALFFEVGDLARVPNHDDGAVVERVMKGRAGHHETIDERHRRRERHPRRAFLEELAGGRPMQHDLRPAARVGHGDDDRRALADHADMADESFVEDGLDGGTVIGGAFRHAPHGGEGRERESIHASCLSDHWTPFDVHSEKIGQTS